MDGHTEVGSSSQADDTYSTQSEEQSRARDLAESEDSAQKNDMLQQAMKNGSKDLHELAEKATFMLKVIGGGITRQSYSLFLADLYHIYLAMEEEVEKNKQHPILGAVYFPVQLNRKQAIEKDLEFFLGTEWAKKAKCTFAAHKYVERIRYLGRTDPAALIAHCYGRYLGDLSGGQILRYKLSKHLNLKLNNNDNSDENNDGLSFYRFENIDNLKKFKDFYSGRLNGLILDTETFQKIVNETRVMFQLNIDLFTEMDILAEIIPGGYSSSSKFGTDQDVSRNSYVSLDGSSNVTDGTKSSETLKPSSLPLQFFEKAWLVSTCALFAATIMSFMFTNWKILLAV